MDNINLTGKITAFSARRRWTVVLVWIVILAAAAVAAGGIGDVVTDDDTGASSTEAGQALQLIEDRLRHEDPAQELVVVESDMALARSPEFDALVDGLVAQFRDLKEVVSAVSYRDGLEGLISDDGQTVLIPVTLDVEKLEAKDSIDGILAAVEDANSQVGFSVATVGMGSVMAEFMELAEETMTKGESLGIGIALLVMLVVFGAAVTAGLPILLALGAIIVAIGLSALVGQVYELHSFVVQIITMIGLAVGIDYALFVVKRYGEELDAGKNTMVAITTAGSTAGRTVLASGFAVMIALAGMLIIPHMTFRSFGIGAILVVLAAVIAALTLLPAVLSILGRRAFWLRIPFVGRNRGDSRPSKFWYRLTETVTAHPVMWVVLTTAVLIATASSVFTINLGSSGIDSLPEESRARHAFEVMNEEFSSGLMTANVVIDTADASSGYVNDGIANLRSTLVNDSFFGDVTQEVSPNDDLVLLTVVMKGDFTSDESRSALDRLRSEYIPESFGAAADDIYVGGTTAEIVDDVNLIKKWMMPVFGIVLGTSFLLLMVVFRSIVVPFKAVVMNLLSVGAAYGLLVLIFQKGVGADLFGFQESPVIEYWLPLFLFSILFGLSMDYHVFLLSRIREHYDQTRDNTQSVAFGLRSTAGIITGAALIMVAVFGGFAAGDLVVFQQMGFGLAAAVIIDATLIRLILVPASMELLGDWNWYLPSWLEWLPEFNVEGHSSEPGSSELELGTTIPLQTPVAGAKVGGD